MSISCLKRVAGDNGLEPVEVGVVGLFVGLAQNRLDG